MDNENIEAETPKKAVSFSLLTKGPPDHPRWMISDQWGRVWNDKTTTFVDDAKKGTLYEDFAEAAWALHGLLIDEYKDKAVREFVVPIKLKVYSDTPLTKEQVAEWCHKACRMLLDANGCGYGPLDNSLAVVAADWPAIKEVTRG